MFKKKGSLTLIAVMCALVCISLGVFYGVSRNPQGPEGMGSAGPASGRGAVVRVETQRPSQPDNRASTATATAVFMDN